MNAPSIPAMESKGHWSQLDRYKVQAPESLYPTLGLVTRSGGLSCPQSYGGTSPHDANPFRLTSMGAGTGMHPVRTLSMDDAASSRSLIPDVSGTELLRQLTLRARGLIRIWDRRMILKRPRRMGLQMTSQRYD
jgi:hypothetical protein